MDNEAIPDVPNDDPETYCRLCFSGFYVEPVFPHDAEPKQDLLDLIAKHVEIHITPEADYPCSVCRMCQMTLEGFHKYRERCRRLDEVLQQKRLEMIHMRVKVEHQEQLAQNAVGFEDNTIYCLSDTDDEDLGEEVMDGVHGDLGEDHQDELLDEEVEEELIKGDILLKPEPYDMDEYGQTSHGVASTHPVESYGKDDVVVLDSEEDEEQSMEASTRASSEAHGEDYAKDEPTKSLPFEVTSDGAYRCTICKETFRLMKEIKTHIRKDHPQESQIYSCRFCAKKFSDTGSLRVHTRFHTMDFPYSCDECGAKFTMKNRLEKHTARYHDKDSPSYTDKRFTCSLCPRIFLQEQARNMHITHFHDVKLTDVPVEANLSLQQVLFCEQCNESFDSNGTFNEHNQKHHQTESEETNEKSKTKVAKRYKCPDCSKLFRHRTAFRSHIMINHGTMPHKCDVCGSCFERKTKLTKHKERWHGENAKNKVLERYKCDHCERYFVRNQDRVRHEQIVHSIESPAKLPAVWEGRKSNFPCSKCDRKFPSMKTMRIHFSLKHPEVPVRFKCTVCSKLFKHKTSLRDHMANHTGQQPYGCVHCEERFVRKKDMERHLEAAHGADGATIEHKETFACGYCPRKLLSKTARALHIRHHHSDKEDFTKQVLLSLPDSLVCSHCDKVFTNRNTLKLHVLNHLGKLPHQCDQCDAGFYKPADLLKHKQRYHTGGSSLSLASRFKCAYCPRIFIRKSARRYHHTVFHGMLSKKNVPAKPGAKKRIKPDPDMEYPCALCSLVFVTVPMLETHHQQHHSDQEFFYKCPHCPKRTTHRNTYLSHIKVHVGGYRHPCDECNAQFDRRILLVSHKRLYHSTSGKETPRFQCSLCPREFIRNQDRVRHQVNAHNYRVQGSNAQSPGPSKPTVKGKGKIKLKIKKERMVHESTTQDGESQQQQQVDAKTEAVVERSRDGFYVSSDVEEYEIPDDDEEDATQDGAQQNPKEGDAETESQASVPTISNVVSIKQEAISARRGYSEYPSEF
ncbi:zinc finger protein 84-like [Toxorhynchites rutilus septentrionalis]|uniref:zinc finger protein 84-like n=1 Tax=Toxorhynchites rutilus septentrionalis TaxID=329112 RepID=UPI00247886B5|nr:zinc finger protein 84-like [Toxorhynchites rutilus septentrionalis]